MQTIKGLAIILGMLTILSSVKAEIVCEKNGRYWYPKNDKAIKIAKMLGVKTCNGKRFKQVVAGLNETSNVRTAPKKMDVVQVVHKKILPELLLC